MARLLHIPVTKYHGTLSAVQMSAKLIHIGTLHHHASHMPTAEETPSASARSSRTALYLLARAPCRTTLLSRCLKGAHVSTLGMCEMASTALSALRIISSLRST